MNFLNSIRMDISKYNNIQNIQKKRTGLLNIGATCYINTLIQCLLSCPVFREFILSKDYYTRITNNDKDIYMIKELESIFNSMWVGGHSLKPIRFLKTLALKFDYIYVNEQNDVHEIFLLIINKLNEEIKTRINLDNIDLIFNNQTNNYTTNTTDNNFNELKTKCTRKWFKILKDEYSELNEIMYYHSISQILCGHCNHIHHNHDISCVLDIELGKFQHGTSLKKCIENHISKIHLNIDEDSNWKCDKCNNCMKSEKVIKFWKLPPVLVICLKRFGYDKKQGTMTKINTIINIPFEIDLNNLVISGNDNLYVLNAVSCHIGNIRGGHYYSLVNTTDTKDINNNKPYKFKLIDDTSISNINDKQLIEHINNNAYLLFYTKK